MSKITEATARREMIDPTLKKAGWDVNDPQWAGLEISVDGFDPAAWHALYRDNGEIIDVDAVERWFTPEQVQEVLAFAGTLAAVK